MIDLDAFTPFGQVLNGGTTMSVNELVNCHK